MTSWWRDKALKHHPNRCLRCGTDKELTADHIIPRSQGGSDDVNNLRVLCRSCHQRITNQYRRSLDTKITYDGRIIERSPVFKTGRRKKVKLAGSRSKYAGRQQGW